MSCESCFKNAVSNGIGLGDARRSLWPQKKQLAISDHSWLGAQGTADGN